MKNILKKHTTTQKHTKMEQTDLGLHTLQCVYGRRDQFYQTI